MNRSHLAPPDSHAQTPRTIPYAVGLSRIDPDAARVVRRLVHSGHMAYLVGGCVRDLLLNRTPKDFDVATSARPSEVRSLFRNCRVIGRRFRLAHVIFGAKVIEVATFRKDPTLATEPGDDWEDPDVGRRGAGAPERKSRPGDDQDLLIRHDNVWGEPPEDAARRDFTMNALFFDLERRELVDYVGGLADIEHRVIRTIGDADVRFREDPVRILRAVKFAARLDLGIEPEVYDAMVAHREDLLRSARPRLLEELLRLLRGGAARRSFWLAWETGVLSVVLPELSSFLDDDPDGRALLWGRLKALDARVAAGELPSDAVLFAVLLQEPTEEVLGAGVRDVVGVMTSYLEEVQERLAFPRRLFDRMRQVLAVQRRLRSGRHQALIKRDYYPDAAALFSLDAAARGMAPAEIRRHVRGASGTDAATGESAR